LLIAEVTGENISIEDFLSHVHVETRTIDDGKSAPPATTNATNRPEEYDQETGERDEEMMSHDGETKDDGDDGLPVQTFAEPIDMHVIGHDENVKKRRMMSLSDEQCNQDGGDSSVERAGSNQSVTFEELRTMELLQRQLMETEKRAQSAEEKAFLAESELKEAEERIRFLERCLQKTENVDCLQPSTEDDVSSETKPPEINISTIIRSSPYPANSPNPTNSPHPTTNQGKLSTVNAEPETQISSQEQDSTVPGGSTEEQTAPPEDTTMKDRTSPKVADSAEMENYVSTSIESKEADVEESLLEESLVSNDSKNGLVISIDGESLCSISPTLIPSPDEPPV